jgi:acetyl/propionyl-CoA carboxylase alpha subunit
VSLRKDSNGTGGAPSFARVLVANRGEIAIRVIRACREMGIESIAVYSDADADALHVDLADRAERIGPRSAAESYLNIAAVVEAAARSGAEAVHPGYGFLSENAAFARAVLDAGLVWIGPPPETQEALGNKLAARRAVAEAGVPIVPGLLVPLDDDDLPDLSTIGLPAMLKAAAGGGGRGMRRIDRPEDLPAQLQAARREAQSAFGDGTVYVERLVQPARHIEVQLLGDKHGALATLGERDCSVQRRHQKLVEESPSPAVTPEIRAALYESARRVAGTVEFSNAATVEFLLDADGNHYFLEMNTRLQVEHGVTELVTGLDLVAWQIRVAAGERLPAEILEPVLRGNAVEVRLYAEDPWNDFRPLGGTVTTWRPPQGPGVRMDGAVKEGLPLTPEYDPLLGKLMVHAADRPSMVARLRRALDEMLVGGLQTDLGFHRWLVDRPSFATGEYHTGLIAEEWGSGPALSEELPGIIAVAAADARATLPEPGATVASRDGRSSAWAAAARREALR